MMTTRHAFTRRRSLVLTNEGARHPFRASLPLHVRSGGSAMALRSAWQITRDDVRGFASAYLACLLAAFVFIL